MTRQTVKLQGVDRVVKVSCSADAAGGSGLPRETGLRLKTVNGKDIEIEKTSGKFNVENINGGVRMRDVAGAGRVYALNGKVRVWFAQNPTADCYFGSLNGNVEVFFRPGLAANARLKTFNGKAYSDFPVSYLPADPPLKKSVPLRKRACRG